MDGRRDTSYVRTMVLLYSDVPNLIAGILMGANFITKQLDGCLWRKDLLLMILTFMKVQYFFSKVETLKSFYQRQFSKSQRPDDTCIPDIRIKALMQ